LAFPSCQEKRRAHLCGMYVAKPELKVEVDLTAQQIMYLTQLSKVFNVMLAAQSYAKNK
jgi:hypothetical protein